MNKAGSDAEKELEKEDEKKQNKAKLDACKNKSGRRITKRTLRKKKLKREMRMIQKEAMKGNDKAGIQTKCYKRKLTVRKGKLQK